MEGGLKHEQHFTYLQFTSHHYFVFQMTTQYYKSWLLKRFKMTNLLVFINGHVHLD